MTSWTFNWPHAGQNVQIAGTFNQWQPRDMIRTESGWTVTIPDLDVGKHEFKFIVDGEWVHDIGQDHAQNEVGTFNNVIEVVPDETNSEASWEVINGSRSSSVASIEMVDTELIKAGKNNVTEVERKFCVPPNYKELLEENGFTLVQEDGENLQDDYYDTPRFNLMRQDFWLRLRNLKWELKYSVDPTKPHQTGTTVYHESTNADFILEMLRENFDLPENRNLGDMVEDGVFVKYARLKSKRQTFKRGANISVVIDELDDDLLIGEIEVILPDKDRAVEAIQRIEQIAKTLNFGPFNMAALGSRLDSLREQ